jgi:hypothetical protein
VITEAAFYLRGRVNRGARAVRLGITLRQATETLDLAALTARLDAGLGTNIVSRRFSPGLVVPAGAEVRSELKEAEGGSQGLALSVSFYGYYL